MPGRFLFGVVTLVVVLAGSALTPVRATVVTAKLTSAVTASFLSSH